MQERVCDAHSATRPKSMSRILSLSMIVLRRWAIVKIVRSAKPLRTSSCAVDNFIRLWLIMWQPQALRQATHRGAAEVLTWICRSVSMSTLLVASSYAASLVKSAFHNARGRGCRRTISSTFVFRNSARAICAHSVRRISEFPCNTASETRR